MPTGETINASALIGSPDSWDMLGVGNINDGGGIYYNMFVRYSSSSAVSACPINVGSTYASNLDVSQVIPMTFAAGDYVNMYWEVGIAEWSMFN
jgi:hypothetical protein